MPPNSRPFPQGRMMGGPGMPPPMDSGPAFAPRPRPPPWEVTGPPHGPNRGGGPGPPRHFNRQPPMVTRRELGGPPQGPMGHPQPTFAGD